MIGFVKRYWDHMSLDTGWPYQLLAHLASTAMGLLVTFHAPRMVWVVVGLYLAFGSAWATLAVLFGRPGLEKVGLWIMTGGYLICSVCYFVLHFIRNNPHPGIFLIVSMCLLVCASKAIYRIRSHAFGEHLTHQLQEATAVEVEP